MGNLRPISTKCWIAFLKFKGYDYDRTTASHYQYTKPGKRTIPVQQAEKEVPGFHIHTSCKSIGCPTKEAYAWVEENC